MPRFKREAQVLAALNHPNMAAVYGVETRSDRVPELAWGCRSLAPYTADGGRCIKEIKKTDFPESVE